MNTTQVSAGSAASKKAITTHDIVLVGMFGALLTAVSQISPADADRRSDYNPGFRSGAGGNGAGMEAGIFVNSCLHFAWCGRASGICKFPWRHSVFDGYDRRIHYGMAGDGISVRNPPEDRE